jgi:hypothetical protein
MKKIVLALPLLAIVLASCSASLVIRKVYFSPVAAQGGTTALTAYPLFVETNWRDDEGNSYVCDDRSTAFSYGFRYEGDLVSWTYELDGESTDSIVTNLTLTSPGVIKYGPSNQTVAHSFTQDAGMSPRSLGARPQSIIIDPAPPQYLGSVRLVLNFKTSTGGIGTFVSPPIPVVSNCG